MSLKRITASAFQHVLQSHKTLDGETLVVKADAPLISTDAASRTAIFKISSATVDRDGDVIDQKGWLLDNYKKNPVVMWGHQYELPPIGTSPEIGLKRGDLFGTVKFFDKDTYEFADTIHKIVQAGGLRTASVGFKPYEADWNDTRKGADIKKQELLEWSVVSIPSNPDALLQCALSMDGGDEIAKSFIAGCERALDAYYGGKGTWIPREQIEAVFKIINDGKLLPATKMQVTVPEGQKELPSPSGDEGGKDFMSRCMGDPKMVSEFPDEAQRYAVCLRQGGEKTAKLAKVEPMVLELTDPEPLYLDIDDGLITIDFEAKDIHAALLRSMEQAMKDVSLGVAAAVERELNYHRGKVT